MSRSTAKRERILVFDTIRGATICSMVAFHLCYDLAYLSGIDMPWFTGTVFQVVWRSSISWTFLFIAGWMTSFSRNNTKRAAVYGIAALLVFVSTSLASVDTAVNFGIMFCMAASTLVYTALERWLCLFDARVFGVAFIALFLLTLGVCRQTYPFQGFAWLGFPYPGFSSGDYYPIIPYTFLYLAGASWARRFDQSHPAGYPEWLKRDWCPPLSVIGRASLAIYLIHQPLILLILQLANGI